MPDPRDPRSDDPDRRPLDELFIVGAKYHEPTAAERAEAARRSEKERKKQEQLRAKEIAQTRKALGLDGHGDRDNDAMPYDRRRSLIAFGGLIALSVVLSFTQFVQ